jgi:hypothetical protein
MKPEEVSILFRTLCGCVREVIQVGLPPREIRVPIQRAYNFAVESEDLAPTIGIRIRRFEMTDHAHPFYTFTEKAEP